MVYPTMSDPVPQKSQYATDAERWQAVVNRDASARPAFVLGVITTGIYCRPGCTARLPNRQNVRFFDTSEAAEAAGFRPCKRCKPQQIEAEHPYAAAMLAVCQTLETAEVMPDLNTLASQAGLSPYHFHRLFHQQVGVTPKQYFRQKRLERVRQTLVQEPTVTGALYQAGYETSSAFYTNAVKDLGMQPNVYRKGGPGMQIRYAIVQSYLGWALIAATERGICAIEFGDEPPELEARLSDRFPRATLISDDSEFQGWVEKISGYLEAPQSRLDLPLDVQGTAFQQRVWQALREIPVGSTVTYTEIAERIGEPRAVRAVAHACASNKIAVIIPCHRVIRSDGTLAGYRWGLERKRKILERERP